MSEEEKIKRSKYQKSRKFWIKIQTIIILVVSVLALISSFVYYQIDKTYYINYTEDSSVDYKVYLKDNTFYDEEYLGKDQVYVASLIENVVADFVYELDMKAKDVP